MAAPTRNPWSADTVGARIYEAHAERARELAESFVNGNRGTVADELTAYVEPAHLGARVFLVAEVCRHLDESERETLAVLLANRAS